MRWLVFLTLSIFAITAGCDLESGSNKPQTESEEETVLIEDEGTNDEPVIDETATPDPFFLGSLTGGEAYSDSFSSSFTVSGLNNGVIGKAEISGTGSSWIIKNGSYVNETWTTVENGDALSVGITLPAFGDSSNAALAIGSESDTYTVTTRNPSVQGWGCNLVNLTPYLACQKYAAYYAVPFKPSSSISARYAGITLTQNHLYYLAYVNSISIYSDSSKKPGTLLGQADRASLNDFFSGSYTVSGDPGVYLGSMFSQGYFSPAVSLSAYTVYWIVIEFAEPTFPRVDGYIDLLVADAVGTGYTKMVSDDASAWSIWDSDEVPLGSEGSIIPADPYMIPVFISD